MVNKDYIPTYARRSVLPEDDPPGAAEKCWPRTEQPEELCRCPCHKEGLECHSCYVAKCGVLRLEAEIRRAVNSN